MNSKDLTYKQIFIFWLPLAATWLMMSVEGPFLSAIIARMAEPKFNLAAYGVAFSLALIVEAPIIMIMSASTALVKDNFSFRKMKTFTYTLNLSITLIMLILLIPPIFNYIAIDLINLPEKVAGLTYTAVAILLPWPGAIGYRRFYQGILIRYNLTRRVAYGTIIRLFSMSAAALIFYFLFEVDGVIVGAAALSTGVTAEGIASKLMALGTLKKLKREETPDENKLTYGGILAFYYPLALTSMLSLGVHPMVTFFIGQAPMALESLAVLPVINSLVFIFRSLGLSYQEVGIALLNNNAARYIKLRNFAIGLGGFVAGSMILISVTPISKIWFHYVSGLSNELTDFSILPTIILSIMPALTVLIAFQRSVLVDARKTKSITFATLSEVMGIILVLLIMVKFLGMIGIIAAASAFVIGRLGANIYLVSSYNKALAEKFV